MVKDIPDMRAKGPDGAQHPPSTHGVPTPGHIPLPATSKVESTVHHVSQSVANHAAAGSMLHKLASFDRPLNGPLAVFAAFAAESRGNVFEGLVKAGKKDALTLEICQLTAFTLGQALKDLVPPKE